MRQRAPTKKVALTDIRVAKMAGEGFRWDEKVDGLAVRVTKAGAKSFVFRRQVHGRLVNITLGKTSGMTVEDARRTVLKLNGDTADGRDIRAERKAQRAEAPISRSRSEMRLKHSRCARAAAFDEDRSRIPLARLCAPRAQAKARMEIDASDIEAAKAAAMRKGRVRTAGQARRIPWSHSEGCWAKHDNPAAECLDPSRTAEPAASTRMNSPPC